MGASSDTMNRLSESAASAPRQSAWRLRTALPVFALVVLCFAAFANTLKCYFIADDYIPLAYLHSGFHGSFGDLMARLVQPWQDSTVQLLYRPISELTLIFDYAIWRGNAFGWHLTNIFWHAVSTVAFFFVCRMLVGRASGNTDEQPLRVPFAAAALFAVAPIHTETVAWMIGRVDSICAAFYLCSLLCFASASRLRWLGVPLFGAALLSKEMAVTLPVVLVLFSLIFREPLRKTAAYWLALIPYFAIRTCVLGTPLGGYTGSIGDVFRLRWHERLIECRWDKLFYPNSDYAFSESSWPVLALRVLYGAMACVAALRWLTPIWRQPAMKLAAFSTGWFVISMLPALPVWYLNGALTGGRFLYLSSAPLCLLMAALLIAPKQRIGAIVIAAFVACNVAITFANSAVWVKSGEVARRFVSAMAQAVSALPPDKKLVLLDQPLQANDEHLFYNASMYLSLLKPPLSATDLSDRVACRQPNCYVTGNPINASRVRQMLDSHQYVFYRWDSTKPELKVISSGEVDKLTRDALLLPCLAPIGREPGNDSLVRPPFKLKFDVSHIPNAERAVLEISRPNSFFVQYTRTFRDTALSAHAATHSLLAGTSGEFSLSASEFPVPAIYQIRIAAVDKQNRVIGSLSDPVSLDVSSRSR